MTKIRFSFVYVAFRLFFCYDLQRQQRGGAVKNKSGAPVPCLTGFYRLIGRRT